MTHSQLIYRKNTFSKWLLSATLILSLFAFSGYATEPQPRQSQAAKTELVLCHGHPFGTTHFNSKRISCYRLLINAIDQRSAIGFYEPELDNAVLQHARLIKTSLNSLTKHFLSFNPVARFHPLKTIPQSTDEDSFNSRKG